MSAVVVLAHALRHFSEQALREISDQSATALSPDDVRWVVTVPAIWTAAAKQLMRQAAYDVSLSVCGPYFRLELCCALMLVLDPHPLFVICRTFVTY